LSRIKKYEPMCKELLSLPSLKPVEGNRIDSAHEAIHPTVEPPRDNLSGPAQKIYDLICRRFLSAFAKNAIRESIEVVIDVEGNKFLTNGRRTLEKGWMEFYGPFARFEETSLPDLKKGDRLDVKKLEMLDKETLPPKRYSQASIINELEKRNLGTRATRSSILQTLYDRNYIIDRNIHVTDLGLKMAQVIKNYVPDFADEKLTRKFEEELEGVMSGKEKKEKVLDDARVAVTKICDEFKQHEDDIGKELGEAIMQMQDEKSVLGKCPNCGKDLKVMFSPKTRKYFVGCTGYKDGCRTAFPLPGRASVQPLNKVCDKCKTPIIKVIRKGRRQFIMCLDPKCETKADWGKRKEKK
jgi:DNA topoisomerase-1